MLSIMAGTDLKYSCSGMYKAGFSGVSALRAVLPEAYRKIGFLGMACLLLRSLVSGCNLFERLPEEYMVASFLGDDSRNGFSIQHSSWFNSGYMFGISLRGFLEEFHAFLREGRTLGS